MHPDHRAGQQATLIQTVCRGAWVGLRWASLIASIGVCIMLAFGIGLVVYAWNKMGARAFDEFPIWQVFGGCLGFFITTCGWGAIIGGLLAAVRRWVYGP